MESWRHGDTETRGHQDWETWICGDIRQGNMEACGHEGMAVRRLGDKETW